MAPLMLAEVRTASKGEGAPAEALTATANGWPTGYPTGASTRKQVQALQ
jgi:hypothetical protein